VSTQKRLLTVLLVLVSILNSAVVVRATDAWGVIYLYRDGSVVIEGRVTETVYYARDEGEGGYSYKR